MQTQDLTIGGAMITFYYNPISSNACRVWVFIGFYPYLRGILQGAIKPHVFSWAICEYYGGLFCPVEGKGWLGGLVHRGLCCHYHFDRLIGLAFC